MYPKQFLSLLHDESMLQRTLLRLDGLQHQAPILVCNQEHRFIVGEQARQIGIDDPDIILEPFGRNTAPAIAVAAIHALQKQNDPVLLVLSADHEITDEQAFRDTVMQAFALADAGNLVTFGIVPTTASTAYGYIKSGEARGKGFAVDEFVEKPNRELAESYLASGDYYWNSGMFMFKAKAYIDELEKFQPDMVHHCFSAVSDIVEDIGFLRLDAEAFAQCESDSIDYAVMEKTQHAVVVPMDVGWSDIGSWSALWEQQNKDDAGNTTRGDVIAVDTKNSLIHSEGRLVATLGVENLIIVETADAVLVADKSRAMEVRNIVEKLGHEKREEENYHRIVYRPWGSFDSVDEGERHKVKRIIVNPGAKLSMQMHHHRAEHWIIVKGTARVYRNDDILDLTENESVYIPLGARHSLENPGKIPLHIIEVQTGSYLGEDDIVRFDDIYGRSDK
jgi:mannose-1-phosphate guanylyltransferase